MTRGKRKRKEREFHPLPGAVAIHWRVFSACVLKSSRGPGKSPALGILAGAPQSLLLRAPACGGY